MTDAPPTPEATARARSLYDLGPTVMFASRADPRFHYAMYVPPIVGTGAKVDLIVAVHGTGRTSFLEYRNDLSEFGRWNNAAILTPIFPVGVRGDGARSGYKYIQEGDIRYDRVLLDIVAEVEEKYRQDWSQFALLGYSGGGHFTHRFAILHPKRLWAASIGAPGSVTLLDPTRDWWVGIRDINEKFGIAFDPEALARVPMQCIVGEADLETWEITHQPGSTYWMEGANDAGRTRPERSRALADSFEKAGVKVRFDLVPGVSHDRARVMNRVKDFLADALAQRRKG